MVKQKVFFVKVFFAVAILLISAFSIETACFAEDELLREKVNKLEKRIEALEKQLIKQNKHIDKQEAVINRQSDRIAEYESRFEHLDTHLLHGQVAPAASLIEGLNIAAGTTLVLQGTHNANATDSKNEDSTDISYSADIEIEKEFEQIKGRAFIHLEAGQGAGVEDELTLYSNVNRDADNDNNVRLTEAWYEQLLFDEKALLTFGKLDFTGYFDGNEFANNETTQFLGRIFRNSPVIEFPDNTAGLRVAFIPKESLEFNFGICDGNSDWEDIGDNLFKIAQLEVKTKFFGREGNYRILGWHSSAYHTRWLDTTKTKEANFGFGLSFDQRVSDYISLFTRFGWQDPRSYNPEITATGNLNYSLEYAWSLGLHIEGKPWGRDEDVLSFAVGQAIASGDYKNADSSRSARSEGHFETYYNIHVNDYLSISPDFQLIWNPFGKDVSGRTDTIAVFGLRTQVDF